MRRHQCAILPTSQQPVGPHDGNQALTCDKVLLGADLRCHKVVRHARELQQKVAAHELHDCLHLVFFRGGEAGGGDAKSLEHARVDGVLGYRERFATSDGVQDARWTNYTNSAATQLLENLASKRLQDVNGVIFIVVRDAGSMLNEELAKVLAIDDRLIDA
eukprot:Mycagemm_TRINITY_DN8904_c0_g2::TRINITY_DN8904_c0_g2_i1::g.5644::m.5644 type:complete len:161 gc:universal TRINITY_DN8904_c0_g2_i1:467-949(+)